jgi:hypothetical protein
MQAITDKNNTHQDDDSMGPQRTETAPAAGVVEAEEAKKDTKSEVVYWRRGLVGSILVLSFALLVKLTPSSSKEEIVVIFLVASLMMWNYVLQLHAMGSERIVTLAIAIGALGILLSVAIIAFVRELVQFGILPESRLQGIWLYITIGYVTVTVIYWIWNHFSGKTKSDLTTSSRRATQALIKKTKHALISPEPPPASLVSEKYDWLEVLGQFGRQPEPGRLSHLVSLCRIFAATNTEDITRVRATIIDEVTKLQRECTADIKSAKEDLLSQSVQMLLWGKQKLPELTELDMSDLIMAKVIADINRLSTGYESIFVSYKSLKPIHAINRGSANAKCDDRADAARKAISVLQANGMRLSESLIAAEESLKEFQSVTGFQVVQLSGSDGGGYVTFEGNGRRESLKRAFQDNPNIDLFVEVRLFQFVDEETTVHISQQVQICRRWKGVLDE